MTNPSVITGRGSPPPGFVYKEQPYSYAFNITLTGTQNLPNQIQQIRTYAGFMLYSLVFKSTGLFYVRIYDGQNYSISNTLINVDNILGTPSDPWIFNRPIYYPPGGKIIMDFLEGSGSSNSIQIVYTGMNKYLSPASQPTNRGVMS